MANKLAVFLTNQRNTAPWKKQSTYMLCLFCCICLLTISHTITSQQSQRQPKWTEMHVHKPNDLEFPLSFFGANSTCSPQTLDRWALCLMNPNSVKEPQRGLTSHEDPQEWSDNLYRRGGAAESENQRERGGERESEGGKEGGRRDMRDGEWAEQRRT